MNTDGEKLQEYLKRVTSALHQTRLRLREVEAKDREPIAVVGMSCRYPGGVRTPSQLWALLRDGKDAISPLPDTRGWKLGELFDPDPDKRGKIYVREGGFLYDADCFDPDFFGISPREALAIDPQQRLLLETSYEAIERAGIEHGSLHGSRTGVFVGVLSADYGVRLFQTLDELEGYLGTGSAMSVASGRIAYTFGLEGPAITIDTACSSSLVAVHLACQALRNGECSLALAGGVTVMSTPSTLIEFCRQRGLSVDGRSRAFSADASGFGVAEGVGMLALARLADARRSGYPILALIRGSAVNQDGRSQGLTAPNGPSQQRVILAALQSAQLSPGDIDAVEAHGTGTTLGDPIEAQALIATYGQAHTRQSPLWLGSLKSNIGHTQAAAGAAGLMKMVLAMQEGVLPKTLHAEAASPHIDWSAGTVRLLTESREWNASGRPRRAAVSSFGISGTNAHVILEEAPKEEGTDTAQTESRGEMLLLSGKTEGALREQAARLRGYLEEKPELRLRDVEWTLATRRTKFEHRAVVVAGDRKEAEEGLGALAEGETSARVAKAEVKGSGGVVFVFPGQGTQWEGMGRRLLESSEGFRAEMEACSQELERHLGWSVMEAVKGEGEEGWMERVEGVQPVLFAMMAGLAAVWREEGVEPDAVVGHSQGEVAAAYVAGALSLEEACRVVAVRSRALKKLEGKGGMAAVELSREEVAGYLERYRGKVGVAASNGPTGTVVSGDVESLEELVAELVAQGIFARRVRVSYASHSEQVEPIREELLEGLGKLRPGRTRVKMYSTVTGEEVEGEELGGEYWVKNLRQEVRFWEVVKKLLKEKHRYFVEVSPHPVLGLAMAGGMKEAGEEGAVVGTLRNGEGGLEKVKVAKGELWASGMEVEWAKRMEGGRGVELPTYAFQRQKYWQEPKARSSDVAAAGLSAANHPLLGATVALAEGEGLLLTGRLSLAEHPWLAGHQVMGSVILPGTAFVEWGLVAAQQVGLGCVEELTLEAPLSLAPQGAVQVQMSVGSADSTGRRAVSIHSRAMESNGPDTPWSRHASGTLGPAAPASFAMQNWPPPGARALDLSGHYQRLADAGLVYGPQDFQGLVAAWKQGEEVLAEARLPEGVAQTAGAYALHPALFDAALHALALEGEIGTVELPFAWRGVRLFATGASSLRVRIRRLEGAVAVELADGQGMAVAQVDALTLRPASLAKIQAAQPSMHPNLYRVDWVPLSKPGEPPAGKWGILGEETAEITSALQASGVSLSQYVDPDALRQSLEGGGQAPALVLVACLGGVDPVASGAHRRAHRALALLQQWLSEERLAATRLVFVTSGAIAAGADEDVTDLGNAPLWGLVRTAQAEAPGRALGLVDLDGSAASIGALPTALGSGEPQVALREGSILVPLLARVREGAEILSAPMEEAWHLDIAERGSLENLRLVASVQAKEELAPGQVRIAVHAAGVNFRDVLNALGMYPGEPGPLGLEGAGVVTEVGPQVQGLKSGDRVMGMFLRAMGPVGVADSRMVIRMPAGWSFVQGAATPSVFLTAYYALVELAGLKAGERVLVHAAAGGVGMAAVQVARYLGAEVYGTASESKWGVLKEKGIEESHLGNSRTLEFGEKFLGGTEGKGVDVVLNSLAREYVDESLRLLPRGGRFVEMGKTDVREPEEIGTVHPGVKYRAFELGEAGPERIQGMLRKLVEMFERGELEPLPVKSWDVRRAAEAMRYLGQGRNVGKVVLTIPRKMEREGTVLITGGAGGLGAEVAKHLVREHGVKNLVLCSRQGASAPGARELVEQIEEMGAEVRLDACDVADREAVEKLLRTIPAEHPLTGVFHSAMVLDDGVLSGLDAERIDRVFLPKVDGAQNLHELTREKGLAEFVMFSSVAGVVGAAGQGSYAGANAYLDALAAQRRAEGLAGQSLAWGAWGEIGRAAKLTEAEQERVRRQGILALTPEEGLELLDEAMGRPEAMLVPVRLDLEAMREAGEGVPRILGGLVRPKPRRAAAEGGARGTSLRMRLAAMSPGEREKELLELVRKQIAPVLGVRQPEELAASRALKELGLDSLMAVELRNRLSAATELRLPSTLLFDHPTPAALVQKLLKELSPSESSQQPAVRRAAAETAADEPIAIVGMSCRYPGGVTTPEELWELLAGGVDAISAFPEGRGWPLAALYDPDPDAVGTTYSQSGGFLSRPDLFDSSFFGLSPREAVAVDPQQRLLLEVSWEAIERAGIDPASLNETLTGVYVGICSDDYQALGPRMEEAKDGYSLLGTATSIASGRISYTLGLQGPAVSIDTACSSSLVAMHLACQALRAGECSLALAGGASVFATPEGLVAFSRLKALAPDGRSKAFAAGADGMGWAEGVGVVVLERMSEAKRKGHPVLAVIRGSATNQDGRSQGLTAPNGPAQQRVIQRALESAGLSAGDVDVVEAHGTGTELGDPIEAQALQETYGKGHSEERPLWLGSIKSNLGHTQAAAGVAGVMKMVLAMQKGMMPQTLHAEEETAKIDWTGGTVKLLKEAREWKGQGGPRRAGVSSFGISGTNAHIILEEAPQEPARQESAQPNPGTVPLLVSAKTESALRGQAEQLSAYLKNHPELSLGDVAWSLATTRTHFEHRAVILAGEVSAAVEALSALAGGSSCARVSQGLARSTGRLAVLFTGQGSQRLSMGRTLYSAHPVFRAALDSICAHLDSLLSRPLLEVLWAEAGSPDAALLDQTAFTQPALFALEVALYRLWESWGLKPDLLLGHSIGELCAVHVAGVLSLADACKLVAARGRLMQEISSGGSMVALQASEQEVRELIQGHADKVDIAGLNGPHSTVLSGDRAVVAELAQRVQARGRKATALVVSHAFHSPEMDAMLEPFRRVVEELRFSDARIPIVSNVSGRRASDEELRSAGYWVRHVRQAVRFLDGVHTLEEEGVTHCLEVGPQGVLCGLVADCLSELAQDRTTLVSSLRKETPEDQALGAALAALHASGVELDWKRYFEPLGASRVSLPTYAFQRQRFWLEAAAGPSLARAKAQGAAAPPAEASFWSAVERGDVDSLAQTLSLADSEQQAAWASVLPTLSSWRQEHKQHSTLRSLRYRVGWVPLVTGAHTELAGAWLLVTGAPDSRVSALTEALSAAGAAVVQLVVEPSDSDRARLVEKLRQVLESVGTPKGVLSLLALEQAPELPTSLALSLALVQALGDAGIEAPLWMLTSGAVSIGRSDPLGHPLQALWWGLGRVVALEHPERWGGLLDVPPAIDGAARQRLLWALKNPAAEDQLVLRPAGLFACRLLRAPAELVDAAASWKPHGTVLITGGTGGLGAHVARWLAREGASHLLLLSRRGSLAPGAEALAAELRALGAQVTIAACDAADRDALDAVLQQVPGKAPLDAVFHAAGELDDGVLSGLTAERVERVLRPKVQGAWNLHEVTKGKELSAFVMFSSAAGVLGNAGQGSYAAANAYLDALAEHRRACGLSARCVAWGAWADSGMVDTALLARLRSSGIRAMAPELALCALQQALDQPDEAVLVADIDWGRFAPLYAAARPRPLLREVPEARQALPELDAPTGEAPMLAHLRPLRAREQMEYVLSVVRGHVAAVLGHEQVATVDPDRGFADLGLDSLMAVELRRRLRHETAVALPVPVVFNHPSPRRLARFLLDALGPRLGLAAALPLESPMRAGAGEAEEPIAIVGMALRLPGGVVDLESFWTLLSQGADAVGPVPPSRWNAEAVYDPDPDAKGKSCVRQACFIGGIDQFDPGFFGISPREARYIDPQHRLLLEGAWEALEQAGVIPASLKDSQTGVFVGIGPSEYAMLQGNSGEADAYSILGTASSFAAGRLAFTLGLQGPAMSVDTACSSSLVALHLACKALRRGECDLALAAGVQVMLTSEPFQLLSRTRALAPDGRSKTFSGKADGYGRGEGVVVVALERLGEARQKGRPVLAVVKGSAVNHDGESSGITAPNGTSQQKVLRAALQDAGIEARDVDVVECHGTGTVLGDPIEVHALAAVYGEGREEQEPLRLGAVKTNIGHLESGAGLAGVAKMVAALRKEALPATLHSQPRNPHIEWEELAVRVVEEQEEWLRTEGRPRRAGVSAFGLSGTNAHVILEEGPKEEGPKEEGREGEPSEGLGVTLLLSGKTEGALREQAARLRGYLEEKPELRLRDVEWTLATRRTKFEHRAVVVAADRKEAEEGLGALAEGETSARVAKAEVKGSGGVVFVFPGQGTQWEGMGRRLLESSEGFRAEMEACSQELEKQLGWSVMEAVKGEGEEGWMERVEGVQPVLFAMMAGLAAVWREEGVEPDAVVGHSQGEVAAAYVAGALSLEEACRVVAVRSRALKKLEGKGGMAAVELSREEVAGYLERYRGKVGVAASNGPTGTVVSGDVESLDELVAELVTQGIFARRVRVSYASHSEQVEPIREELLEGLGRLRPGRTRVKMYSTVTGEEVEGEELDGEYWVKNLRQEVRFWEVVKKLLKEKHRYFVEVSPHPVLGLAMAGGMKEAGEEGAVVGTLRNGEGGIERVKVGLGELWASGMEVEWAKRMEGGRGVELPTYAFQRQRYWVERRAGAADVAAAGLREANHPMLGARVAIAEGEGLLLTGRLSLAEHPWLAGHQVMGSVVLPGTAFVEWGLVAAEQVGLGGIEELTLEAPLILSAQGAVQVQVSVGSRDARGRRGVSIYTREMESVGPDAPWRRHASGALGPVEAAGFEMKRWPPEGAREVDLSGHYQRLAEAGLEYGAQDFQGLVAAWQKGEEVLAEVRLPEGLAQTGAAYTLHPALFDAALHALGLEGRGTVELPFAWRGVRLFATGASQLRVRLRRGDDAITIEMADGQGQAVARVQGLRTRPASLAQVQVAQPMYPSLYRVEWNPLAQSGDVRDEKWVLLGEAEPGWVAALAGAGVLVSRQTDLAALRHSLDAGARAPEQVLVPWRGGVDSAALAVRENANRALGLLKEWLRDERLAGTGLVFVTREAIAAGDEEDVKELGQAPVWGLVRTAQSEAPGQGIVLVDTDGSPASLAALPAALGSGEPQMALREGVVLVPRVARVREGAEILSAPMEEAWHLDIAERGSLENLRLVPSVQAQEALAPGQVRIAVKAAGVNFRDVLNALGMYPGEPGPLGLEGAGVVMEVGPNVRGLKPGERVMGLFLQAIGPVAVADSRTVIRMPKGWSYEQGAATPSVFVTAYYGLVELAGLKQGERVLIHAAAGGVGMAAVQVARQLGAEVYATASERKWGVLKEQGIAAEHIGNSRELGFGKEFLEATKGQGVDVVLNSLAREYVDESLRVLPRGGRFIEMGKTDVREPEEIEKEHPGVRYRAFDLGEAGPERIQKMLETLVGMFEEGTLSPLPVRSWDVRRAAEAMRHLGQGRNVGKVVLTIPRKMEPEGTVLITGGTGGLGALLAKHLVKEHGVRNLMLCSRQGECAPGAAALVEELEEQGARVRVEACDVADRAAVEELLGRIPEEHPLTGVFHSAMVLDDGVLSELDGERIDRVFLPKVDGAQNLHELTRDKELAAFVLFSSAAGVVGAAGQGNYAGANAYLDALAAKRRAEGLAGQSLAWGAWGEIGRAAKLGEGERGRLRRQGVVPLSPAEGLDLLDAAMGRPEAMLVPVHLDLAALREAGERLPRLFSGLVRPPPRRAAAERTEVGPSLKTRLGAMNKAEREEVLLELVRRQAGPVLGVRRPEELEAGRPLKELGLDSLMAVELRNRLSAATELALPSTLLFDHPTPTALVQYLDMKLAGSGAAPQEPPALFGELSKLETLLLQGQHDERTRQAAAARLQSLLSKLVSSAPADTTLAQQIDSADDEQLFALIDGDLNGQGMVHE